MRAGGTSARTASSCHKKIAVTFCFFLTSFLFCFSQSRHSTEEKKKIFNLDSLITLPDDRQGFVTLTCVCACVFIKLHIAAQSGPVMVLIVVLCHSHWCSQGVSRDQ